MFTMKAIGTTLPNGAHLSTLSISMEVMLEHYSGERVPHQANWLSSLHHLGRAYKILDVNERDAHRRHHACLQNIRQKMAAARPGTQPPAC